MADTIHNNNVVISSSKKRMTPDDPNHEDDFIAKKLPPTKPSWEDPVSALANARHEFGEHGGVNMSIEASATFTVMEPETLSRMFAGELGPDRDFFIYSRHFNPTVLNLGRQMAALEGTEAAYCTASGMSAISSVLLTLVSSGDNIVASQTLYGGTHALLTHFLPRSSNIQTTFVDIRDLEKVKEAIVEGRTKVLYFESMSNPTLTVANIPELSRIAHEKGVTVVVDNTFAPMVVSPARLGADVVVHSISKYISGGADIIAGAVCGPASLVNSLMDLHQGALMLLGPTMNAKVAFELSERIPHLGLRVKEHCHRALVYAQRMKKMGLKVIYPGLEDHPDHLLLKSIANKEYGFGGMLCLDMGTEARANKLMNLLQNYTQFGLMAVSLGYYETLMSCSGSSTSSELNEEEQALAGISPGLVRMSVGYSGTLEQRWGQFEKALSKLQDMGLNALVMEMDNMAKLSEKCNIQVPMEVLNCIAKNQITKGKTDAFKGLRRHLLEELEQAFPDEVEDYREIRASSAAVSSLNPPEVSISALISLFCYVGIPYFYGNQLNALVMEMDNMAKLSEKCNIQVPMEVLNLIDDGKNPDEFTRDVLNSCIAKNQITKGKTDAFKGLRRHLLEELEQAFPDEVEDYREIRASSAAVSSLNPPEVSISALISLFGMPYLYRSRLLVIGVMPHLVLEAGLRRHLLEELEQAFPDEVEDYREIRASSAAVSSLNPPEVSISALISLFGMPYLYRSRLLVIGVMPHLVLEAESMRLAQAQSILPNGDMKVKPEM
ncbi:methionine gamma-lyase [Artemisia annua]|uniref:Methionine gamma-lyase n=1 Tax=Artemisia annua TaxID=35608 RepID=A0A2U1Q8C8_ARTAN|nr:methionine gamma-lyase [Artemisia annua]